MTRNGTRRGTTAVEFAVTASVLLMLVFSAIELGLLYLAQQALNHGVATATRYAVVNSGADSSTIVQHFTSAVQPVLGAAQTSACQVTVAFASSSDPGGSVTVRASLAWRPVIGFSFIPSVALTSADTATIQH